MFLLHGDRDDGVIKKTKQTNQSTETNENHRRRRRCAFLRHTHAIGERHSPNNRRQQTRSISSLWPQESTPIADSLRNPSDGRRRKRAHLVFFLLLLLKWRRTDQRNETESPFHRRWPHLKSDVIGPFLRARIGWFSDRNADYNTPPYPSIMI